MDWQAVCWRWLIQAGFGSLILYGCACLALAWRRQPAQRLRLIELALVASLAAPCLSFLPGAPAWSIGGIDLGWRDETSAISDSASAASDGERANPGAGGRSFAASIGGIRASVASAAAAWWNPRVLRQTALAAYGLVAAGFFVRWLAGVCRLSSLARSARPAPAAVYRLLDELAGADRRAVRLLASAELSSPLAFGWRRPAIMLPEELCYGHDREALRYCLAHEWSHVERGDARLWCLAALAQVAFFYQPLFWRLRRQVRLCQDFLADARAAEQGAAVEDYAEYLVAVARRQLAAPPAPAMGFGDRRSNLYRRVLMLIERREPLERRCGARWNCAFGLAAAALAFCASSVRLDADENRREDLLAQTQQATTTATEQPADLSFGGRVIDHDTGKPIAGATIVVRRRETGPGGNRMLQETLHVADADGAYAFTIASEQLANRWLYVEIDAAHPGFASQSGIGCSIDALRKSKPSAGRPSTVRPSFEQIALRRGEVATGIIETFAGEPAAGVDVLAYSQGDGRPWEYGAFARTKTDSQGRFRITLASPGDGVLYLQPAGAPPAMYVMRHKRGDLGRIRLPAGIARTMPRTNSPIDALVGELASAKRPSAPID